MGNPEYDVLFELISDVQCEMSDLFQSGFTTVHEISIKKFLRLSKVSEAYGLHKLSNLLERLTELIEKRRHSSDYDDSEIMNVMCDIFKYTEICEKRIRYENILTNYSKSCNENINN